MRQVVLLGLVLVGVIPSEETVSVDHNLKVKAVSNLILSKLGMYNPPTATDNDVQNVDPKIIAAFNMTSGMKKRQAAFVSEVEESLKGDYYAKTVFPVDVSDITATFDCQPSVVGKSRFYSVDETQLKAIASSSETIKQAQLQIYYNPVSSSSLDYETILIAYQLTVPCSDDSYVNTKRMLDLQHVTSGRPSFVNFNVTKAVQHWLNSGTTYGIEVQVFSSRQVSVPKEIKLTALYNEAAPSDANKPDVQIDYAGYIKDASDDTPADNKPTLFLTLEHSVVNDQLQGRRRKRALDQEYCDNLSGPELDNCCIREFYIDFKKDLGWTWIIQPKGFYANECSGECPMYWAEDTNHTQVINEYRTLNPEASVAPCCTPKTLNDLEMLHFPGGGPPGPPITSTLTDMLVTSCICA
eukprot:m.28029 g.28029  ORF g.28029 m.28029 type:complete len:411 (+) comp30531_c0_seq1:2-1234(+)